MSETIGEAVIVIGADATEFAAGLQRSASAAGKSISSRIGGALSGVGKSMEQVGGKLTRTITVPALGAAAAAGGIVAALGWSRLSSLDAAQAQLRGLGYEAADVERISDGLVDALDGGMLTMAEATFAAAGAMASGVQEGAELTRYIQLLDAAVAGGTGTFDEMNQMFARVTDQGYLTREVFDMIAQRMPGFSSAVQQHMGVGSEAMYEMLRNGEISQADFLDIMEGFAGGMATEYAKSWDGMVQNTKAYIGILGENLLGGVFEQSKESIAEFIDFLSSDEVAEWAEETGKAIGAAFEDILAWVQDAITWFRELSPTMQTTLAVLAGVAVAAGPIILILGKIVGAIGTLITVGGQVFGVLGKMGGAFKVLWAVIAAHPIVAIVTVIVAALVWFFTQTEAGQKIIETVWEAIKAAIAAVADWFQNTLLPALQSVWDGIVAGFEWVKGAVSAVGDALQAAWRAVGAAFQWVYNTLIRPMIDGFNTAVGWLRDNVLPVFRAIGDGFSAVGSFIFNVWANVIGLAWDLMAFAARWLWNNALKPVFDSIRSGFSAVGRWISDRVGDIKRVWEGLKVALKAGWDWIDANVIQRFMAGLRFWKDFFSARVADVTRLWEGLKAAFRAVWDWIDRNVFSIFRTGADNLRSNIGRAVDGIKGVWDGLKAAFRAVWDWIKTNVIDRFRDGVSGLGDTISSAVDRIGRGWRRIANLFREPINWVINTVWNNGLKAAFDNVAKAINSDRRLPRAPNIPRFADGGRAGRGWAIVGEEGPELVNFSQPGRVYTAEQSQRMLAAGTPWSESNPPHGAFEWLSSGWDAIKRGASAVGGVIRDAAGNVLEWARGGLAELADIILSPIFRTVSNTVGKWGDIGRLGGDAITGVKDRMVDWIRGEDEKADTPDDPGGRSLRGARPHVNAAAFTLADRVGGIRLMQAFNRSMAGGHPKGLAVDFIDSVSKLNRLSSLISGGMHFDRFNYMAWQARLWSPGRGWRPQGRGFGNDPWHRWHLHAEWFDKGGLLKKGWNAVYNGTGRDEQVANVTGLVERLRRGALDVPVPQMAQRHSPSLIERMRDEEVRLTKDDMDYLADRLAAKLWPMARASDMVGDLASMGRTRRRMGG